MGSELGVVDSLGRRFRGVAGHPIVALDDVSLKLFRGQSLGLVGESGSGKTTLGRIIARLDRPDSGKVQIGGRDIFALKRTELLDYRRRVQMIFQNSSNAYNPRRKVLSLLTDGLTIHNLVPRQERANRAASMLENVGLPLSILDKYPHQCSGGQRQRIGIARALSVEPELLIADEPVSGLDMSVQAQVLNLLSRLKAEHSLSLIFITHDLRAAYFLCERIAVMYLGHVVEIVRREDILQRSAHPYTRGLIASVPIFKPGAGFNRRTLSGETRTADSGASACPFVSRCPQWRAMGEPAICKVERPALAPVGRSLAACHFPHRAPTEAVTLVPATDPIVTVKSWRIRT